MPYIDILYLSFGKMPKTKNDFDVKLFSDLTLQGIWRWSTLVSNERMYRRQAQTVQYNRAIVRELDLHVSGIIMMA